MPTRRQLLFGFFPRAPGTPEAATGTRGPAFFAEHCLARQDVVCRACGDRCPEAAIRFSPRVGGAALPTLIETRCTGCGDCLPVCPNAALSLRPAAFGTVTHKELVA